MAKVESPTGPPPNWAHNAERMARSTLSRPRSSTPNSARPSRAVCTSISPLALTSAKSLTRRSNRLAIRGVPRLRRAISQAPGGSMGTSRMRAARVMMASSSSGT